MAGEISREEKKMKQLIALIEKQDQEMRRKQEKKSKQQGSKVSIYLLQKEI